MSSAAYEQDTSVEREAVVAIHPRRVPTAAAQPEPVPQPAPVPVPPAVQALPPPPPPRADHAFVGVLSALTAILAARLLLLLSVTFGFVLAVMAVRGDSYLGLSIVGTFCGLTVIPLTWLDVVTHRRGGK